MSEEREQKHQPMTKEVTPPSEPQSGIVELGSATELTKGKGGRNSEAHNPRP